jgi:hypothetical protein
MVQPHRPFLDLSSVDPNHWLYQLEILETASGEIESEEMGKAVKLIDERAPLPKNIEL